MDRTEQTVRELLKAAAECQNELFDISASLRSHPFGTQTDSEGGLEIENRDTMVVLHLKAVMQVGAGNPVMTGTEFEFRVSMAIADAGWRASSLIEARLAVALKGHAPDRYVMHEEASPLLEFEPAMVEFRSQVNAMDGYADRLERFGLVRGN